MTEIKQKAESPQAVPVEWPAETATATQQAHSPVARVTEKKASDPNKVATGRAGAAARQKRLIEQLQANKEARQKRLIEQLQAAKESLRPPVSAADNGGTTAPPQEAKPPKRTDERPEHNHNWIPWIIGACLAGGSLADIFAGFARGNMHLHASPMSVAAGPAPKDQDKPPQLKACPDPHYMESDHDNPGYRR